MISDCYDCTAFIIIFSNAINMAWFPTHVSSFLTAGMTSSAATQFPETFLFSGDFDYTDYSGKVYCNDTIDTVDMCTDKTTMAVSKANGTCTKNVAYSGKCWSVPPNSLHELLERLQGEKSSVYRPCLFYV